MSAMHIDFVHDAKLAYDARYKPVHELLQFATIMTDALRS